MGTEWVIGTIADGSIITMVGSSIVGDMQFVKFYRHETTNCGVYDGGMALRTPNGYTENIDGSGPYYPTPMAMATKLHRDRIPKWKRNPRNTR